MNLDDKVMVPRNVASIIRGPIPLVVPIISGQGRYWAGDDVWRQKDLILKAALEAPPTDQSLCIAEKWCNTSYDLPVAVVCFGDQVKVQKESGFMQGIVGVTTDMANVAVKAGSVRRAVADGLFEKNFKVTPAAFVKYGFHDDIGVSPTALVNNVVLFPYNGRFMELDGNQFMAIDAEPAPRDEIPQHLPAEDLIKYGNHIYPYSDIFPEDIALSLIQHIYELGKKFYGSDTNMGFVLPGLPENNSAEMWALYVDSLYHKSHLHACTPLGDNACRLVGVIEGLSQK